MALACAARRAAAASQPASLTTTAPCRPAQRQRRRAALAASRQQSATATTAATAAPVLSKDEQASLDGLLRAAGLASIADVTPDVAAAALDTISKGLERGVSDLGQLEGAMLLAEQLAHAAAGGGGGARSDAAALLASTASPAVVDAWQPIFASAGGFPRLLYIPVLELFDMHKAAPQLEDATAVSISSAGSIDISSSPKRRQATAGTELNIITQLGPLTTHFLGSCAWTPDATTFDYAITQLRLDVGGRSLTLPLAGPLALRNSLSFFLTTPAFACARSRLGGTMLLRANPPEAAAYFDAW